MELSSSLTRQMSIGDADFAERLAEGQKAAIEGDVQHPANGDEDEPEWLDGHNPGALQPAPAQTQMEDMSSDGEEHDDDRDLELLNEKYGDLNAKTFRMKELMTKKAGILNKAGDDPYNMMEQMHDTIDAMEDGEQKTADTAMYNAIYAIYESARKNKSVRNFVAEVFKAQWEYYEDKEQKEAINAELKKLDKLYYEQEQTQVLAKLAKNREARLAALEMKASEKAKKKNAEQKDAGGSSKKAKVGTF